MPDIIIVLTCLSQYLAPTTLRQLSRVTEAMLSMTGRVTMKGISRWTGQGGSYRTVQRFFNTSLSWCKLQWVLIRHHLLEPDDVILMGGDEVVVTKSGKQTHGLERFFFLSVWQSSPRSVFSEFIPDQRQTPHLLPGHDGTN
jgi:putative transposase